MGGPLAHGEPDAVTRTLSLRRLVRTCLFQRDLHQSDLLPCLRVLRMDTFGRLETFCLSQFIGYALCDCNSRLDYPQLRFFRMCIPVVHSFIYNTAILWHQTQGQQATARLWPCIIQNRANSEIDLSFCALFQFTLLIDRVG